MLRILSALIGIYTWIVIARVVISWLNVDPQNPIVKFLSEVTDPVLNKIREVVPTIGGMDLSPLVLIVALAILQNLLY